MTFCSCPRWESLCPPMAPTWPLDMTFLDRAPGLLPLVNPTERRRKARDSVPRELDLVNASASYFSDGRVGVSVSSLAVMSRGLALLRSFTPVTQQGSEGAECTWKLWTPRERDRAQRTESCSYLMQSKCVTCGLMSSGVLSRSDAVRWRSPSSGPHVLHTGLARGQALGPVTVSPCLHPDHEMGGLLSTPWL